MTAIARYGPAEKLAEGGPRCSGMPVDRKGYSTVAVVDGKVYTTGVIGERLVISVFDFEKPGHRLGSGVTKNYPGGRSTPMITAAPYLVSGHGLVGCYDLRSMQKKWSVHD
jgi:hypothetical protein